MPTYRERERVILQMCGSSWQHKNHVHRLTKDCGLVLSQDLQEHEDSRNNVRSIIIINIIINTLHSCFNNNLFTYTNLVAVGSRKDNDETIQLHHVHRWVIHFW